MTWRKILEWDVAQSERMRLPDPNNVRFRWAAFFAHTGDSWFWLIGLSTIWLVSDGPWHTRAALLALISVLLAIFVLGIKFTVRRRRPEGEWGAIYRNTDPHSFPSGHASRAAMLAVMAVGLGPAWFGILLVLWAPLVCLARVSTGVHYISDVIVGFVLGLIVGWIGLELTPLLIQSLPFLF